MDFNLLETFRHRISRIMGAVQHVVLPRGWTADHEAIRPYYEKREPSRQTIIDIFGSSWKSALPGGQSGTELLFDDRRMGWLDEKISGGLRGKSVLELGPFEGYHTYQLDRLGACEIVSVEGNSTNFLKCLCVKEMYALKANLAFGDIQSFLDNCNRTFDVVCASGVLYHSQDPVLFIKESSRIADHLYIWTHYYSPEIQKLTTGQERHFLPEKNRCVHVEDRKIQLYARSYLKPSYRDNLPLYWEGGQENIAYWLAKDDLIWLIEHLGFEVAHDGGAGRVTGLPCIGVYARRVTKKHT